MYHSAEQELEKLQRQYRVMDGERRAYCEESQNVIRKQQYVLLKEKNVNRIEEYLLQTLSRAATTYHSSIVLIKGL